MPGSDDLELLIERMAPGARILRAWELTGGLSTQATAVEVERANGRRQKLVVRRHGHDDREENLGPAEREFKLLGLLRAAGLPAPNPLYLDLPGEVNGAPCLVTEYIEGAPGLVPALPEDCGRQMAAALARIHSLDLREHDLSFLPPLELRVEQVLSRRPVTIDADLARAKEALAAAWPLAPRNEPRLVHGDFWPGNTLWREGQLVAVIDWEDAALGDPVADFANARLEILWASGVEAMNGFTSHYRDSMKGLDFRDLPYWDLWAGLRLAPLISEWLPVEVTRQTMRERHKWFAQSALAELSDSGNSG